MPEHQKNFITEYADSHYKKPSNTVDMVIFTAVNAEHENNSRNHLDKILQLLLIKRKGDPLIAHAKDPYKGKWALPGGFVNYDEDLDRTAIRELEEETNITGVYMEQLYTCGKVYRDLRTRVISTSYMALVDSSKLDMKAGDDAEDARWFTVTTHLLEEIKTTTKLGYVRKRTYELRLVNQEVEITDQIFITKTVEGPISKTEWDYAENQTGLAFDHAAVIYSALERLKNKIEYTDIAFALLPERFTLTELKKLYEVITGKTLYDANFRDKMEKQKKMVIQTDEWSSGKQYRRARLFRFNTDWLED